MCLGQFLKESIKEQKKEQEVAEIKKDDIIKVLAGELMQKKKCPSFSTVDCWNGNKNECITCWILYAEQVINGA